MFVWFRVPRRGPTSGRTVVSPHTLCSFALRACSTPRVGFGEGEVRARAGVGVTARVGVRVGVGARLRVGARVGARAWGWG